VLLLLFLLNWNFYKFLLNTFIKLSNNIIMTFTYIKGYVMAAYIYTSIVLALSALYFISNYMNGKSLWSRKNRLIIIVFLVSTVILNISEPLYNLYVENDVTNYILGIILLISSIVHSSCWLYLIIDRATILTGIKISKTKMAIFY